MGTRKWAIHNIWEERIMGRDPLSSLSNVKEFLVGFDINTFSNMSDLDTLGIWQGWKQLSLLTHITAQVH